MAATSPCRQLQLSMYGWSIAISRTATAIIPMAIAKYSRRSFTRESFRSWAPGTIRVLTKWLGKVNRVQLRRFGTRWHEYNCAWRGTDILSVGPAGILPAVFIEPARRPLALQARRSESVRWRTESLCHDYARIAGRL